ncbi:putative bifunctional diguanylate cyclase/phosphodiesterase [Bacillus sp. FJAT-45350]|uniref:putative bifunctional diguanylate cyclase/phosphodiesterase n=1 Tax=Bacillus sp. FJAT-45350 TaxID=2011014 RepID=UPI0015C722E8|nr:EAL domain-containing protein [Bacillus sp. FJAT-45350]
MVKHQSVTSKIIIRMTAVLIIIAIFNFSLSHIFLKDRLTDYLSQELEDKKLLLSQLVVFSQSNGEDEMIVDEITMFIEDNENIENIALYKMQENTNDIIVANSDTRLHIEDHEWVESAILSGQEFIFDEKVNDRDFRYFYTPINNEMVVGIKANLDRQNSLEIAIIYVDIFVTLFAFLSILLILRMISQSQLKPLGEIERYLTTVSNGDFSKKLTIEKNNEFAWLGDRINEMTSKINHLIKNVKERADDKIEYMAYHDDLTNLPNRRMFQEEIEKHIIQSENNTSQFAILYIDLDGFKRINDTIGHVYGDKMLLLISTRLTTVIKKEGLICRLAGDEFAVIVPFNEKREVAALSEKILKSFETSFEVEGDDMAVSISIGISIFPTDGTDYDTLLRNADSAMYEAKEKGKKRYQFYEPYMNEKKLEQIEIEKHLRKSLENNELILYYQPQVDSESGQLAGVEVLLRWHHEELGMVPPGKFIPIIEKSNLINDVGEWVLRKACIQNKQWQAVGLPKTKISVNVSPRQFQQSNFVDIVKKALDDSGLDPHYLSIEITESVAMDNINLTFEKMIALKEIGIHVAIDDFGTGHSSLRYLKSFPIDTLKIDREFVKDVNESNSGFEIVTAIIALAHSLKIGLIAEGVETEQQLSFLKEKKCFIIQGYFYSKPLCAADFEKWINERKELQLN